MLCTSERQTRSSLAIEGKTALALLCYCPASHSLLSPAGSHMSAHSAFLAHQLGPFSDTASLLDNMQLNILNFSAATTSLHITLGAASCPRCSLLSSCSTSEGCPDCPPASSPQLPVASSAPAARGNQSHTHTTNSPEPPGRPPAGSPPPAAPDPLCLRWFPSRSARVIFPISHPPTWK